MGRLDSKVRILRASQDLPLKPSGQQPEPDNADDVIFTCYCSQQQQQCIDKHVWFSRFLDLKNEPLCVACTVSDRRQHPQSKGDLPKQEAGAVRPPQQNLTVFTCISMNVSTIHQRSTHADRHHSMQPGDLHMNCLTFTAVASSL